MPVHCEVPGLCVRIDIAEQGLEDVLLKHGRRGGVVAAPCLAAHRLEGAWLGRMPGAVLSSDG
eukprot:11093628-Lingulodinium_polyedra.AAC.1